MSQPWIYMCSPCWTPLPPPSPWEQHQNMYIIKCETDHQSRLDAWDKCSVLVHWDEPSKLLNCCSSRFSFVFQLNHNLALLSSSLKQLSLKLSIYILNGGIKHFSVLLWHFKCCSPPSWNSLNPLVLDRFQTPLINSSISISTAIFVVVVVASYMLVISKVLWLCTAYCNSCGWWVPNVAPAQTFLWKCPAYVCSHLLDITPEHLIGAHLQHI